MKTKMSGLQIGKKVLGDQIVEHATYQDVDILGTLHATACAYRTLKILGDAVLNDCSIETMHIKGEATCVGCTIGDVRIMGEAMLKQTKAHNIQVLGNLEAQDLECNVLCYGTALLGKPFFGSALYVPAGKGVTLENFVSLKMKEPSSFQTVLNAGKLCSDKEVECAAFFNFKEARCKEVNADFCYIDPNHSTRIEELHGSLIIIDSCFDDSWLNTITMDQPIINFLQPQEKRNTKIHCIEADEVILDHVQVDIVRANKVTLGPDVIIKEVEYYEHYQAHEAAQVKKVWKKNEEGK